MNAAARASNVLGRKLHGPNDELLALEELCAECHGYPLLWVADVAYAWGEGELDGFDGPDVWQVGFLREWGEEIRARNFDGRTPVEPIQLSTVSGHGVGKTAMVGWACDFVPSTRPLCRGRVTANTSPQLASTTWPEIAKWTRLSITRAWWNVSSGRGSMMKAHKRYPDAWFLKGLAWSEHQPEAFAGQHAPTSTSFYIFDEASGIARIIVDTAKGGMTDGEPMMMMFGNGTKSSGPFYESQKDPKERKFFRCFNVDARTSKIANHKLHQRWIEQYGVDSDFVKVRVLGEFPNQAAAQFMPLDLVEEGRRREPIASPLEPLVLGVDVSRFGDDETRFVWRRGKDAKSIPSSGYRQLDTMTLANLVMDAVKTRRPDAVFIDVGGIGGPTVDVLRSLKITNHTALYPINFGARMKSGEFFMMNAWMMGRLREWLRTGGAIEDADELQKQLIGREYWFTPDSKIMLEPKEELKSRGENSPDWADALCLTFAMDVGPRDLSDTAWELHQSRRPQSGFGTQDYNPFE